MVGIRDAIRDMTGQYKDAVVGRVYERHLRTLSLPQNAPSKGGKPGEGTTTYPRS